MAVEGGHDAVLELIEKIVDFSHFQEKAGITSGISHIWDAFVKDMERILPPEALAMFLVNEETHEFELKEVLPASKGDECVNELDLQIECGVFSWVIGRRLPAVLPALRFKKRTILLIPLCTANRTIGAVLAVTKLEESAITMETLKLLGVLARQFSLVMENAMLYEHLRKEHESLQKAQAQIIQTEKLASIGRLTRAASHEILNPLNIISGYAHLLLLGAGGDSKPSRYLNEIIKESGRIAKVVSGLMQFKGGNSADGAEADIADVVERALSLTEHAARFNKVEIRFSRKDGMPKASVDPEELLRVVLSVINNALEAMPEGGTLTIDVRAGLERQGKKGCYVELEIKDTGCGIPKEIQDRVFEPFFTTRKDNSLGLGLYMSYCIVEKRGGEIRINSDDKEGGTKVTIALPCA
jgi:signal transduction histidine kinase